MFNDKYYWGMMERAARADYRDSMRERDRIAREERARKEVERERQIVAEKAFNERMENGLKNFFIQGYEMVKNCPPLDCSSIDVYEMHLINCMEAWRNYKMDYKEYKTCEKPGYDYSFKILIFFSNNVWQAFVLTTGYCNEHLWYFEQERIGTATLRNVVQIAVAPTLQELVYRIYTGATANEGYQVRVLREDKQKMLECTADNPLRLLDRLFYYIYDYRKMPYKIVLRDNFVFGVELKAANYL